MSKDPYVTVTFETTRKAAAALYNHLLKIPADYTPLGIGALAARQALIKQLGSDA